MPTSRHDNYRKVDPKSPSALVRSDGYIDGDVDVATKGLGVRAGLVRGIHDRLGCFQVQARHTDIEARPENVLGPGHAEIYLSIYGEFGGQDDLDLAGGKAHRRFETGRPTGGKELFRIGAGTGGTGRRLLDVQASVRTAGGAILTGAYRVDLARIENFDCLGHGTSTRFEMEGNFTVMCLTP